MTDKTIVIHSLEHAVAALKVARDLGSTVTLASPPGAAAYTGALWFREVMKEAEREVPEAAFTAVLDCGDKPGLVMAAFRHGVATVRFTGARPEAEKLEAMAESEGYHLITGELESLDLAEAENATEACRGWLEPRSGDTKKEGRSAKDPRKQVLTEDQHKKLRALAEEMSEHRGGGAVLFTGPSGTGKTLAAETLAAELGRPLHRLHFSDVMGKYIGETEKNLAAVLKKAQAAGAVLLFDEADALFGKRAAVKDSHDRYANQEVSYLLQELESYDGLVIITSNRRETIDPAVSRRFPQVIAFSGPSA